MSKTDERGIGAGHDRSDLGFEGAVGDAFSFLVSDFGFHVVRSDATSVRYESDKVYLNVYHGRRSYEIDVEVGRLPDLRGVHYRLREVLGALLGEPARQNAYYYQSSSPEGVRHCIAIVVGLVRRHYARVLLGGKRSRPSVALRARPVRAAVSE